ncbi:MAG: hypothetical protein C3F13_01195 [Anaerolineales bacterium]|nr:hypothetical protein [Anaerolineae bacterium]PWB56716.1 MAG: hypothetical protein C3F13_01195 [Anaerolineales bacterium]
MNTNDVIQSIITLFSEAYAGPPDPKSTWFIDNEPDSGILGLIANVSALEASISTHRNDPGTTIAAHVEHLRWSLANANRALQGEEYRGSWKESWNTLQADETRWEQLKSELRGEYETLVENLRKQSELNGDYLTGVMALIPHAAYHLGTIRQQIERVREYIMKTV